jgi:hypothetical protein
MKANEKHHAYLRNIEFLTLPLFLLLVANSNNASAGDYTISLEEDTFVRCLIGECRKTDVSYAWETDPFDYKVFGTDLGIITTNRTSDPDET